MATSNNFGTSNGYIVYNITVNVNSQNIANNTSNISVYVNCWRTNTGYTTSGAGTCHCGINGVGYDVAISNSQSITSTARTLFSKTLDIGHNSDGTKTIYVSSSISHDRFSSSDQGFNVTLPTIPRTSSVTLSSSNTNFNSSVTLTISRASSSFTHDVYFRFGSTTVAVEYGAGTSTSYTFPLSLMSEIPNATSGVGSFDIYTISGGALIGSVTKQVTLNVPSTIVPSLSSVTATRIDGSVPSSWGLYVQGKSKCTFTFNSAAGTYGSTIKSYKITGGTFSKTNTSNTVTTDYLTDSGTVTFTGTITDSRGRTVSKTVSLTIYAYSPPSISSFSCFRSNSSGTAADEGTYLRIKAVYSYSTVNSKNSLTLNAVTWKRTDGSTTGSGSGSLPSGSAVTLGGGTISASYAWKVVYTLTDSLGSTSVYNANIPTGATTMDFLKGGKGISIGGVASLSETLDVNWKTLLKKGVTLADERDPSKTTKIEFDFVENCLINAGNAIFDQTSCPFAAYTDASGVNQYTFRFYNGVQINWMSLNMNKVINGSWGNGLFTSDLFDLPNYNQTFVTVPTVLKTSHEGGGWNSFCMSTARPTTTWPGQVQLMRGTTNTAAVNYVINVFSIGLWKAVN